MGTFHHDRCDLHGITVVVETDGPELYVGRCDDMDERQLVLLDADRHDAGAGPEREAYLRRAFEYGVWKKFDRLVLPRARVASVRPLGEWGGGGVAAPPR